MSRHSIFLATLACASAGASAPGPRSEAVDLSRYDHVFHVDANRGDDIKGDGSERHPFASIVHGLEQAGYATAGKPAAILVSGGRYAEPTFSLRAHVDLFGGYAAPGGGRDLVKHPSMLDGEEERRILIGVDHARLDGFSLVGGRVRGKGAAIVCDGVSPVIANCTFTNNRTLIPQPWEPPLMHETAHDGGAIVVLNGARPRIERNYFFANATECGRGGALSVDRRSNPAVVANVFANNLAGLVDPMRSSDGGAVSWFDWSGGEFNDNVLVANEALTSNDAGGAFIALWSAPSISRNQFVANICGDDAGGLFIGGQEHRYDGPLDEYPPASEFTVAVNDNVFVGNANSSKNSGAMRITMESRVALTGNIIAENVGGMYLQRSEILARHNTVWQDWRFVEDKPSLGSSVLEGNILKGPAGAVEARVKFKRNMAEPGSAGDDSIPVQDVFVEDAVAGAIESFHFDRAALTTVLKTAKPVAPGVDLAGRCIRVSQNSKGGQWRVIKSARDNEIVLWGRLEVTTGGMNAFDVLRSFTLKPSAPADIGAGARTP